MVTDEDLKKWIFEETTFSQYQVQEGPVIIICGPELFTFVKGHPLAPVDPSTMVPKVKTGMT